MPTITTYEQRRGEIAQYFDRTAAEAWRRLTSTDPVGRIRETVRAGRNRMRRTLLDWIPEDLAGRRILDAGCGTGALAVEAALRGAEVVAIDLSPTLVALARERSPASTGGGNVEFRVGDMLDPNLGEFDHVLAMDSLIHYRIADVVSTLTTLGGMARESMLFTFAPRTPPLALMHAVGRLLPHGDRAPSIEPVAESRLRRMLGASPGLADWRPGRTQRIHSGFYTSQAFELVRR